MPIILSVLLLSSSCKRKVELREIQPVEVKVQVIDTLEQGYVTTYVGEVEENQAEECPLSVTAGVHKDFF